MNIPIDLKAINKLTIKMGIKSVYIAAIEYINQHKTRLTAPGFLTHSIGANI